MRFHWLVSFVHILVSAFALAQAPQAKPPVTAPPPALPAGLTISEPMYPLPLEERDKIRDLQHEYDQIEIENQKMLVKVEQNKARQSTLVDGMKLAAFNFSQTKKLDLEQYEFDPAQIRFTKKKTPKP